MILVVILAAMIGLAALAPLACRALGRDTGYVLAAAFAAATVAVGLKGPQVVAGQPVVVDASWVAEAGLAFHLRLDALALVFALLVLGVGACVLAYAARYFGPAAATGRTYGFLTAFAAAMLGLVLAGDIVLLFVFWELTSVTSFFLIGGTGGGGKAAARALIVTGIGGLALLAAGILLGQQAGSLALTDIVAAAGRIGAGGPGAAAIVLLVVAATTKSAQVPAHFWLPGAMVAPTPVSTYLHAATMVKAGVYLLLRLAPVLAEAPVAQHVVLALGLTTAVWGGLVALGQDDLKRLLAFSTVSQLGLLVAMAGIGTPQALAACVLHTIGHAFAKGSLFMVAGVLDTAGGSRSLRELGALRRRMPLTAVTAVLGAASMAGIAPLLGFVSKEEMLAAFAALPLPAGALAAAAAVSASVLTVAYALRIVLGVFASGGAPQPRIAHRPPFAFDAPGLLLGVLGLVAGLAVGALDPLVGAAASAAGAPVESPDLALWHGFTVALVLSLAVVVGGALLFLARSVALRLPERLEPRPAIGRLVASDGARAFDMAYDGVLALGGWIGRPAGAHAPAVQFAPVLAVAGALAVAGLAGGISAGGTPPAAMGADWGVAALMACAVFGVAVAGNRLAAVALLGVTGFLVAIWYVLLGAPDLALTQLLVETLTVAVVVFVFRGLPRDFHLVPGVRKGAATAAAGAVGAFAGVGTFALTGRRELSATGADYLDRAEELTGGGNVVNTILVDFRALDTLGELTVLLVAAVGIVALMRRRDGEVVT
ncbi:MAG: hydrogen gas-evolving membrane-bound hydrogenase subunit E [Egibacteraceae bacterium]